MNNRLSSSSGSDLGTTFNSVFLGMLLHFILISILMQLSSYVIDLLYEFKITSILLDLLFLLRKDGRYLLAISMACFLSILITERFVYFLNRKQPDQAPRALMAMGILFIILGCFFTVVNFFNDESIVVYVMLAISGFYWRSTNKQTE